jgi:hemolysin activation/secretion protein
LKVLQPLLEALKFQSVCLTAIAIPDPLKLKEEAVPFNPLRKLIFLSILLSFCLSITEDFPANAGAKKDEDSAGRVVFRSLIVAEEAPRIIEPTIKAVEASAQVAEANSHLTKASLQTAEATPRTPEAALRIAEADPRIAEATPQTAEAAPQAEEATPQTGDADAGADDADAKGGESDAKAGEEGTKADEADQDEGEVVLIKAITFTGNTVIATGTLESVTEEFKDQDLTWDEIKSIADSVTMAYQELGYILAKAYVPEQEIKDGVLEIRIVEGNVGKLEVAGNKYYHERVIKRYFQPQMKHGIIRESMLERALLLTKELPKVETRVVLKKGQKPGTADMTLAVEDKVPVKLSFDFNNFGSRLVGEERFGTLFQITEPWWGSTLELRGTSTTHYHDSAMGSAKLNVPLTSYGTMAKLSYLNGDYAVGQELEELGLLGESIIYGARIFQPFVKTAAFNFGATVGYDRKYAESYLAEEISARDKLDVFSIEISADYLDQFLGKTFTTFSYSHGVVDTTRKIPISRINYDKRFDVARLDVIRVQKIYGYTNVMVRFNGQLCGDRLVALEQSVLGGFGTVRGHAPAAFLGDSGYVFSTELMFAPPFISDKMVPKFNQRVGQMVQFAVFFDNGGVYTTDEEEDEVGNEFLSGWGVGLRLFYKERFRFKFDVGWPIHDRETKFLDDKNAYYYFLVDCVIF